jgi:hypothetical protein
MLKTILRFGESVPPQFMLKPAMCSDMLDYMCYKPNGVTKNIVRKKRQTKDEETTRGTLGRDSPIFKNYS